MNIAIEASNLLGIKTGCANYAYKLIKALTEVDRENFYYILAHGRYDYQPEEDLLSSLGAPNVHIKCWRESWYHRFMLNQTRLRKIYGVNYFTERFDWRILRPIFDSISINRRVKLFKSVSNEIKLLHMTEPLDIPQMDVPIILMIHDITLLRIPQYFSRQNVFDLKRRLRQFIEKGIFFICNSEYTRKDFIDYFKISPDRIKAIHLGVDDNFVPTLGKENALKIRNKYQLKDSPYILYMGRVDRYKNIENIIKAFNSLVKKGRNKDHILVIAGSSVGNYGQHLLKMINELGLGERVIMTGFIPQDDLPLLLSNSTIFIYLSIYEGFGLSVVEAMACGAPVITSNVSSLPEVAGDAAILVDPYNVEQIADSMETLLYDYKLRETLKAKSLNRAKQFSWEKTAQSTLQVYKEILRG